MFIPSIIDGYPEDSKITVSLSSGYLNYAVINGPSGGFPVPCGMEEDALAELKTRHPMAQFYVNDTRPSYVKKTRMIEAGLGITVYEVGGGHRVEVDVQGLCQAIKSKQYNAWELQPLVDTLCNSSHFVEALSNNPYFMEKLLGTSTAHLLASKIGKDYSFVISLLSNPSFIEGLMDEMKAFKQKQKDQAISAGLPPPAEEKEPREIEDRWDEIE